MQDVKPTEYPAMELKYMKLLRFSMHYLGFWPYAIFGQKVKYLPLRNPTFLCGLWSNATVLQILYIKNNQHLTLYDLGLTYVTTFMIGVCAQRAAMTFTLKYRQVIKKFVNEIHLINYKEDSEFAKKTKEEIQMISSYFCYFIHVCIFGAWATTNITPILFNYFKGMYSLNRPENGTFQHVGYYSLPFDYTTNLKGYIVVFIYNFFESFDCGAAVGVPDLFLSILVFHVWGHMKILEYNLKNFPRPKLDSNDITQHFSQEESIDILKHLKKNIDHHRQLKYFMKETSDAFGISLGVYFAFHQTCLCILLLLCSTMDSAALGEYGMLTIVLIQQLMQVSIIFELISSKSEQLPYAVYSVPWELMGTRERKITLIFLTYTQETMALKAMGVVPVGVQTMATILRTSISYFLMLRTFAA